MGFNHAPEAAFIAFKTELEEKEWAKHDTSGHPALPGAASSLQAPCGVRWKLRMERPIRALQIGMLPGLKPQQIDTEKWDPAQDRIDSETKLFINREDSPQRQAALRVRPVFLLGKGTAQKRLSHEQEVTHGRMQVRLANEEFKADIATLGLEKLIDQIDEATEELAEAIGMGPSQTSYSGQARQQRKREGLAQCVQAFSAVLSDIEWQLAQPETTDDEKKTLEGLRAPLVKFEERYPAPKKATTDENPDSPDKKS